MTTPLLKLNTCLTYSSVGRRTVGSLDGGVSEYRPSLHRCPRYVGLDAGRPAVGPSALDELSPTIFLVALEALGIEVEQADLPLYLRLWILGVEELDPALALASHRIAHDVVGPAVHARRQVAPPVRANPAHAETDGLQVVRETGGVLVTPRRSKINTDLGHHLRGPRPGARKHLYVSWSTARGTGAAMKRPEPPPMQGFRPGLLPRLEGAVIPLHAHIRRVEAVQGLAVLLSAATPSVPCVKALLSETPHARFKQGALTVKAMAHVSASLANDAAVEEPIAPSALPVTLE
eukprot:CAMPEP_0179137852 /NCGR_PEP_ID=MMETSP0796-20121207/65789_1 /TAXON_ID=73915 /ORGANISM="Pyrodinium bahamense, Strain pbaha01" /LENGTH=290 /DNA_ID=CAMNT_0020837067 /DNA_START=227 /DNA_END=1099 /DNA_ORIENTATION=+